MSETDLPINKPKPTAASDDPAVPVSSEPALASTPDSPLVVSEAEVAAVTDTEKLSEQIEILSGEIQALEAKIERLMNSSDPAVSESGAESVEPLNQGKNSKTAEATPVKEPTAPPVPSSTPTSVQATPAPVNDIYAKHLGSATTSATKNDNGSAELDEGGVGDRHGRGSTDNFRYHCFLHLTGFTAS